MRYHLAEQGITLARKLVRWRIVGCHFHDNFQFDERISMVSLSRLWFHFRVKPNKTAWNRIIIIGCCQKMTESRVYSPLSVIFYVYLGVSPPLFEKSCSPDHIIKCGLKISFSLFTAAQNLKSQTSNRHGFFCGGVDFRLTPSVQPWAVLSQPQFPHSFV